MTSASAGTEPATSRRARRRAVARAVGVAAGALGVGGGYDGHWRIASFRDTERRPVMGRISLPSAPATEPEVERCERW